MSFADWHSGQSVSTSSKQEYGFVCMSTTVDDLSYTPSEEERYRDAEQFAATGRRSWKTLKGKGEAVWPPILEAALLEALEKYQPENLGSKSDKILGRFPMRNRFISDYIFEITGKRRTPKQVGSRLQQLRDTCKKEKILQLISHRMTSEPPSDYSPNNSPSPSPAPDSNLSQQRIATIHVKIVLQNDLWPSPTPYIDLSDNDMLTDTRVIQLAPSASPPSNGSTYRAKSTLGILPFLNGCVEFISPCALMPQSTFAIYVEGSSPALHTESSSLKCLSSPIQRPGWLYGTEIAPAFWGRLCSSQDVTRYTIVQTLKVMQTESPSDVFQEKSIRITYAFSASSLSTVQNQRLPLSPLSFSSSASDIGSSNPYSQWTTAASQVDSSYPTTAPENYGADPTYSAPPISSQYSLPSDQRCMSRDLQWGKNEHPTGSYYPTNLGSNNSNYEYANHLYQQQQQHHSYI